MESTCWENVDAIDYGTVRGANTTTNASKIKTAANRVDVSTYMRRRPRGGSATARADGSVRRVRKVSNVRPILGVMLRR